MLILFLNKQYFSYLSNKFLTDPERFKNSGNLQMFNYNNFWSVPAPIRVIAFFWQSLENCLLVQKDRLVSNSTYSLSFRLMHEIGYWDTDVIPKITEYFSRAFFAKEGQAFMEPIFLKTQWMLHFVFLQNL